MIAQLSIIRRYCAISAMTLCIFDSSVAEEQCISLSNLPNSESKYAWIPNATLASIDTHRELRKKLVLKQLPRTNLLHDMPYGFKIEAGDEDILWISQTFKGWSGLTDTETVANIVMVIPTHIRGEGEFHIGGKNDPIIFVMSGSPAFKKYRMGYALDGKLSYLSSGAKTNATKVLEPIVSAIGPDAVLIKTSFRAALFESGSMRNAGSCLFDASLIFRKEAK